MIDALVAAAKGWRGLAKLVLLVVQNDEQVAEVVVKLGETRRRWKRVATAIAPLEGSIVGARGYDAKGELVGAWDVPDDDEEQPQAGEELPASELAWQAAHRLHTQWCLRESAKMFEGSLRLTTELVGAVVELIRAMRTSVATANPMQAPPDDETTKTLGLLLQSFMASQNQRSNDGAEPTQQPGRSPGSDADGQGQPE